MFLSLNFIGGPSPALSSLTQRDRDMLSIDLPGDFAANTGNSGVPASRLPESIAYPSPSSSIQSMKDEGDRTPAHDNLDAGIPGRSEKESEPSSVWTDKQERVGLRSSNIQLNIMVIYATDHHPTFRISYG